MLDPHRNLLTVILVGLLGVMGAVALAMVFLLGRVDIDRIPPSGQTGVEDVQVDVPETGLAAFEEYSTIMERPVFFSDRRLPVVELVELDNGQDEDQELEVEEQVEDLKAGIAGIVITPDMKLAMVRDDAAGKTLVLREGMSLEGEQAAWRLESILPREVSFVSVDGRRTGLELKVHTSGLTVETPRPQSRMAQRDQARAGDAEEAPSEPAEDRRRVDEPSDEARARAEEIRRRVAERRAELRAEAERRAREQQRQDNDG